MRLQKILRYWIRTYVHIKKIDPCELAQPLFALTI